MLPFAVLYCHSEKLAFARFEGGADSWCLKELRVLSGRFEAPPALAAGVRSLQLPQSARSNLAVIATNVPVLAKTVSQEGLSGGDRRRGRVGGMEQLFPFPPEGLLWDALPVETSAGNTGSLVVASRRELVEKLCSALVEADLVPGRIEVVPVLAAGVMTRANAAEGKPLVLLHCADDSASWIYLDGKRCRLRCSRQKSETVSPEEHAGRLGREMTRWLEAGDPPSATKPPVRVLIAGDQAEALVDPLEKAMGLPVVHLGTPRGMSFDESLPADFLAEHRALMLPLFGAALSSPGQMRERIDLLPSVYRREQIVRRRRKSVSVVLALLVLAGAVGCLMAALALQAAGRRLAQVREQVDPVAQVHARMQSESEAIAALQSQVEGFHLLSKKRYHWIHFLAHLQGCLAVVENVWIDSMELENERRVKLSGRILDPRNPLERVSVDMRERAQLLIGEFAASEFIGSVSDERFDAGEAGLLRFSFVLTKAEASQP